MKLYIAHADHPGAHGTPVEHGIAHWELILPITIIIAAAFVGCLWLLARPKLQKQEVKDKD